MRRAFYPPLLAAFLVLALFNANSRQLVSVSVVGLPLLISVGGACALWTLGRLILRSWNRAALPTCVLTIMLLGYGYFRGTSGLSDDTTLKLWIASFALVTIAVAVITIAKKPPTLILNALATGLILAALAPFCNFALRSPTPQVSTTSSNGVNVQDIETPDIYYIILDEYSRNDALLDMCNFDNSEFTKWLRSKGFYTANDSYTSYPATVLYLAATLNMNYLPGKIDLAEVTGLMNNNEVYKQLKRLDYTFVHIYSWFNVLCDSADITYRYSRQGDFSDLALSLTPFYSKGTTDVQLYKGLVYQFDKLKEIPQMLETTFTFAHIPITHAPYLFNRDGSFRDSIPPTGRMYTEPYIDQIQVANDKLKDAIETILTKGNAVIILQSDTGTQPQNLLPYLSEHEGTFKDVIQKEPSIVRNRLANLTAIYPDIGCEFVSSANTFRYIFNYYFNATYEILPDRYFFTTRMYVSPFEFFEVTDSLENKRERQD